MVCHFVRSVFRRVRYVSAGILLAQRNAWTWLLVRVVEWWRWQRGATTLTLPQPWRSGWWLNMDWRGIGYYRRINRRDA